MSKVTIIVPVYNVENYLRRCLDSILKQSYSDFDIICINDCSPDHCDEILDDYAGCFPEKLKVLKNEKNIGLGRTRERGIRHASGEYLMFIDSDDYIREDFVQSYVEEMEKYRCDIVIGGYIRDVDGNFKVHKVSDSVWSLVTYPIACAKMFRKEFLLENKLEFSNVKCGEDIYFSLCAFSCGAACRVIDYAGYYYYFNRASITGSLNYTKEHEKMIAYIFDSFMRKYDLHTMSKEKQDIIEYTYIANMMNALINYGHGGKIKCMKKKYEFFINDMSNRFPDYKRNPHVGILKPKGQSLKIRLGVGIPMKLHKIGLDRMLFYMISLI